MELPPVVAALAVRASSMEARRLVELLPVERLLVAEARRLVEPLPVGRLPVEPEEVPLLNTATLASL